MRIRLVRLYGENLRSFARPFSVDFPESGLVLITGINKNTGDSSASGKSSLVLAAAYLFGGCPFPATDLQTWGVEEPMKVGGLVQTDAGIWKIERGTKGLVVTPPNGKPIRGKSAEAELNTCFGMDSWLRAAATYRGQGQGSLFLNLSDQEKKEFLTRILGLDAYEKIAALASEEVSKLSVELGTLESMEKSLDTMCSDAYASMASVSYKEEDFSSAEETRKRCQDAISCAEKKRAELEDTLSGFAKNAIARYAEIRKEAEEKKSAIMNSGCFSVNPSLTKIEEVLERANNQLEELILLDAERQRQIYDQNTKTNKLLSNAKNKAAREPGLRTLRGDLKKKLKSLEAEVCPTCSQKWSQNQAEIEKTRAELANTTKEIVEAAQAEDDIEFLAGVIEQNKFVPSATIERLKVKIAEVNSHRKRIRAEDEEKKNAGRLEIEKISDLGEKQQRDIQKKVTVLEAPVREAIRAIDIEISSVRDQLAAATRLLSAAETVRMRFEERKKLANDLNKKKDAIKSDIEDKRRQLNAQKDLNAAVGRSGFLGVIFDQILDEIAAATNAILARVANVRHVSFSFASERETQSGSIQRKIIPIVSINGRQVDLTAGLSGGMKSAVSLAVDLAVGEVAAKRRGTFPGWLILDETFDGLGRVSKESCIDMLQSYAHDRLVLVIDHSTEFQASFEKSIMVESVDGVSSIV
jgi:DNA repair exonuclease SbcCD ATPase subunit